jgi:hypothetical protein
MLNCLLQLNQLYKKIKANDYSIYMILIASYYEPSQNCRRKGSCATLHFLFLQRSTQDNIALLKSTNDYQPSQNYRSLIPVPS